MEIMERFDTAYQTDDEDWDKKEERLLAVYEQADMETKEIIDDIFTTLCGWTFKTLMEGDKTD